MKIPTPPAPIVVTMVALLLAATVTDLRSRRIPNWLTFPAIALALTIRWLLGGWTGLLLGVAGGVLAPVVLLLLRAFRRLGMGDIKLAVAVGALLGPTAGGVAMLVSAVFGGLVALAVMLRPRTEPARLLAAFFVGVPVLERVYRGDAPGPVRSAATLTIPYGVALSAGSLLTLAALRWI